MPHQTHRNAYFLAWTGAGGDTRSRRAPVTESRLSVWALQKNQTRPPATSFPGVCSRNWAGLTTGKALRYRQRQRRRPRERQKDRAQCDRHVLSQSLPLPTGKALQACRDPQHWRWWDQQWKGHPWAQPGIFRARGTAERRQFSTNQYSHASPGSYSAASPSGSMIATMCR